MSSEFRVPATGSFSSRQKVGTSLSSCPRGITEGILALIILNSCSNFLGFAIGLCVRTRFHSTEPDSEVPQFNGDGRSQGKLTIKRREREFQTESCTELPQDLTAETPTAFLNPTLHSETLNPKASEPLNHTKPANPKPGTNKPRMQGFLHSLLNYSIL